MRTARLLACASLALLPPAAGEAASYRFVVLADSATSGVAPIYDRRPSIDEDASVAFFARSEGFTPPDRLLVARDPAARSVDDPALGLPGAPRRICHELPTRT